MILRKLKPIFSKKQLKTHYFFSDFKFSSKYFYKIHPQSTYNQKKSDYASFYDDFICLTDGAIGWKDFNNSYDFAKSLNENLKSVFFSNKSKYINDIELLLIDTLENIKELGEACCLLLILDPKHSFVNAYQIGDCNFLILRKNDGERKKLDVIHNYQEVTKMFNKSNSLKINLSKNKGKLTKYPLQLNDVIISGTDGLFDNMYNEEIVKCVKPFLEISENIADLELVAEIIGTRAFNNSQNQSYFSPFAKNAKDYFFDYLGGKLDDISIIVTQIK